MLETIMGRFRRNRTEHPQAHFTVPLTRRLPAPSPAPAVSVSLDQRYFAVVEAAIALTRCSTEYDSNAFDRSREANARLRTAVGDLEAHYSRIDNPFARNRVSEQLEAELPKTGLYVLRQ